jgi:hypothetical protein
MSDANAMVEKMRRKQQAGAPPSPPSRPPANGQGQPRQAGPKAKARPKYPEFRLPDGATFHAAYDGRRQLWAVTLTVPGLPPYQTEVGSVHAALVYLGRRWFSEHGDQAQTDAGK